MGTVSGFMHQGIPDPRQVAARPRGETAGPRAPSAGPLAARGPAIGRSNARRPIREEDQPIGEEGRPSSAHLSAQQTMRITYEVSCYLAFGALICYLIRGLKSEKVHIGHPVNAFVIKTEVSVRPIRASESGNRTIDGSGR
eukprot:796342-Prorocentrum_minimum.AAC.2